MHQRIYRAGWPPLVGLLLASAPLASQPTHRSSLADTPSFLGYVEDELVVVLSPNANPSATASALREIASAPGVSSARRQFPTAERAIGLPDLTGHYKVRLRPGANPDAARSALAALPFVDHVERIGIHALSTEPNDPYFQESPNPSFDHDQWHMWDTYGIHADSAWDYVATDEDVVVAILDSGVRYYHTDIGGESLKWGPASPFSGGNVWQNPGETPGDGIDNDGNGYIDDTIGWDFVTEGGDGFIIICLDVDCDTPDNDPDDGNGHGTHVAGTVAAITNNDWSVAGVAGGFSDGTTSGTGNGVKILPLKIAFHALALGQVTGVVRMDWAAEAMAYVAALVDAGVNITAVNCSWSSSDSGGLSAAVDALIARDVMIIHAAGNAGADSPDYLGTREAVVNVAATDRTGLGASFTNHGSWVDIAAPGVEILSTSHVPSDPDTTHHYIGIKDGTSVAAPQVAGVAALLESFDTGLSAEDKLAYMTSTATPSADARDLGAGIVNAMAALAAAVADTVTVSAVPSAASPEFATWAYPNPFNPATTIGFRLSRAGAVDLVVYDVAGRVVRHLLSGQETTAGTHSVAFDGRDDAGRPLASGVYFYRIAVAGSDATRKLLLLK